MFTVKVKNNSDWNFYEAKDFQYMRPSNPHCDGNDIVWKSETGFDERHNVDDFVPQDMGPVNAPIKLLLLRQKDDTILTVAFTQDAYIISEMGKTLDKL